MTTAAAMMMAVETTAIDAEADDLAASSGHGYSCPELEFAGLLNKTRASRKSRRATGVRIASCVRSVTVTASASQSRANSR
jgi:flagellar basal body rod protein FlgG